MGLASKMQKKRQPREAKRGQRRHVPQSIREDMPMSHELSVSIARRGAKVDLDMESAAFGVISIDGEQIPAEERPGTAKKLLASSALYCYCAALDKALETRGAKYRRIEGKATVRTGTDDKGRGRVTGIDLDVTVFMDQEYEFIFDRVEKIMKQGCLITGSLEAAFPVKYNLNLECDED
jgi:uncharacterized OsmC-like protein